MVPLLFVTFPLILRLPWLFLWSCLDKNVPGCARVLEWQAWSLVWGPQAPRMPQDLLWVCWLHSLPEHNTCAINTFWYISRTNYFAYKWAFKKHLLKQHILVKMPDSRKNHQGDISDATLETAWKSETIWSGFWKAQRKKAINFSWNSTNRISWREPNWGADCFLQMENATFACHVGPTGWISAGSCGAFLCPVGPLVIQQWSLSGWAQENWQTIHASVKPWLWISVKLPFRAGEPGFTCLCLGAPPSLQKWGYTVGVQIRLLQLPDVWPCAGYAF